MTTKDFDAHCHVFDMEYLLLEMEQMLLDALRGQYPLSGRSDAKNGRRSPSRSTIMKTLIMLRYTPLLFGKANGSELKNGEFLFTVGKKVFKKDIAVIPLMMDFYYAFGPALPAVKPGPVSTFLNLVPRGRRKTVEEVEPEFRRLMAGIVAEGESRAKKGELHGTIADYTALVEKTMAAAIAFQKRDASGDPYVKTVGFEFALERLAELRNAYPDRVFPFVAIDPRRDGFVDYVISGKLLSKSRGPFFGCKLYPRAGYLPDTPTLDPLYSYCERLDVPVTTHCSRAGFPPAALTWHWKLADLGAPENYLSILERHPKLRLNLAHFGGGGEDRTWANRVASLMATFGTGKPNESRVFSDLSGYTAEDHSDLMRWWSDFSGNELVKNQTMFGSDFDATCYTTKMTLEEYDAHFMGGANVPLPLETMMGPTVRRFLG